MKPSVRISAVVLAALAAGPLFVEAQQLNRPVDAAQSVLQKHYDAAQHYQQAGNMAQAARQYRLFIADALFELALGRARLDDYNKAAPLFDEALRLAPNSPALRIEYAQAALSYGDYARAKSLSEGVLHDYANDNKAVAKAHLILGRTLLKMNKDQEAREQLESAVALNPDFENGYTLAVACLDLEDQKCAAKVFSEMQASFGDTAALHMEFGQAYGQSDFQANAVAEFKQAIAENPRLPGAHYSLAAAYLSSPEDNKVEDAVAELKQELTVSPNDYLTYAALGHVAEKQHKYGEAETYLKRAIALNPHNPDAYLYLGQLYTDMNRPVDAEPALRSAIRYTTDPSRNRYQVQKAHFLLGRLLMQSGHPDEAHTEMQAAKALTQQGLSRDQNRLSEYLSKPDQAAGGNGPAQMRPAAPADSEDAAAAQKVDAYEKQLTPAVADSYNNLGAIAASEKDYAGALTDFKRAAEWSPSLEGLDYNWGRAAFSAGQYAEAVGPLTRYLVAHPADKGIRSALGVSQFMAGDYAQTVATLQQIDPQADGVAQLAYVYAASLVKTGKVDEGIARLLQLEKKDPSVADIHRALGEAYLLKKDQPKAVEELTMAAKLNPSDEQAKNDLVKLKKQNP
ncbi:tetratricopeptide repeat protein [Acidipila rosea]|uniref:Tetratricopeptide repeat protein n=1 Tax=Acidipila rosea TaxID=768535 RepID=A0A4R1LCS0_9BACT|nr:tetratricopeptide repeat protein [Acidipila rosea]TCK74349.1 tetratricopeptide repeat protein [Acidipila rosea]